MMKKNLFLTVLLIIALAILLFLSKKTFNTVIAYSDSEKCLNSSIEFAENNSETIFSIDKITYFSSSDAKIETNSNSTFKISGLYQYTDIAIFINPNSENLTAKNTLKSVTLNNISYTLKAPEAPTFDVAAGAVAENTLLTITPGEGGSTIVYTIDG